MGRATRDRRNRTAARGSISIHALRGEGDDFTIRNTSSSKLDFNPRPPWGGRQSLQFLRKNGILFQSTPSVGRATTEWARFLVALSNFNPRPPWGGRRGGVQLLLAVAKFQSTPSVGRATFSPCGSYVNFVISIHALRGEGDRSIPTLIL